MVLSAALESFGLDTENYALNVSSVRYARDRLRKQESHSKAGRVKLKSEADFIAISLH